MTKPFQIGNRVRVYYGSEEATGVIESEIDGVSYLVDLGDNRLKIHAHEKQLRHLRPRRARREFWIRFCDKYWAHSYVFSVPPSKDVADENCKHCECFFVREIREKGKKK